MFHKSPELELCKSDARKHSGDIKKNQLINKEAVIKHRAELFPLNKMHSGINVCYFNVNFANKNLYLVFLDNNINTISKEVT